MEKTVPHTNLLLHCITDYRSLVAIVKILVARDNEVRFVELPNYQMWDRIWNERFLNHNKAGPIIIDKVHVHWRSYP